MKVGVFGLGRFGRFWAEQLALNFPVVAYNRSKRDIELNGVDIVEFEHLLTCDVIFICTAISSLREVLMRIAPSIRKDALIIDTCSVKVYSDAPHAGVASRECIHHRHSSDVRP